MKNKKFITKKFISLVFVYFVFLTLYFSMITLSKYVKVSNGSGTKPIAKWQVSVDTQDNPSDIIDLISDNTPQNYILKVISESHVGVNYTVTLSNVPSELEVSIDNGTYQTPTNNQIQFTGTMNATSQQAYNTHTISFRAPIGSTIAATTTININVDFEQKPESP